MIGQMQGKFQMVVVPGTGHMLHEVCVQGGYAHVEVVDHDRTDADVCSLQDDPPKLAEILVDFWRRNERVVVPGVKKVGEL